jgi:hypothetical protein
MIIARQSTARTVTVGPVLDADGVAVTNGVIGDFKLSKNGGAPVAFNGSATLTHRHTGFYSLAYTASDSDTVGSMEITIDDTVNTCPMKVVTVVEELIYDTIYAASASALADMASDYANGAFAVFSVASGVSIEVGGIAATSFVDNAITASAIAANAITDAKVAADVTIASVTGSVGSVDSAGSIATAVWASGTRTLTANTNLSIMSAADIRTALGLASANLDTQLDAVPTAAENATAVFTTALNESYRSAGSTTTLAQGVYEIIAHLGESSISGTTKTLKKLNGTTAKTFTLDDAVTPTAITETT